MTAAAPADAAPVSLFTGAGLAEPGATVTLQQESVYEPGTYEVSARVVVDHLSNDPTGIVTVSIGCRDKNGHEQRMGHYLNTLAIARVAAVEPSVLFHATDDFSCWVAARAMRINGPGEVVREVLVRESSLDVQRVHYRARATEVHSRTDKTRMLGTTRVVRQNTNSVVASAKTNLVNPAADNTLRVKMGLQLTSCTHVFGSGDQTTNNADLCAGPGLSAEQPSGPMIYTQLFVRQMRPDGSVCRTVEVPGARTYARLSSARHHAPRYAEGTLELSGRSDCGSEIRPFVRMHVSRGPAVVVHWPGSNVMVIPE